MNQKNSPIFSKRFLKHIIITSFLEFGPVIFFLTSFSIEGFSVYESTMILMIATILSTIITYRLQKRIPYLALYVAVVTLVFGYMTLHFHETKFIQMRDTLYDATCAITLLIGSVMNISFLKIAFGEVVPMTNRAWDRLTHLWIGYFIIVATSNEIMRRLFSLEEWFFFKACIVGATIFFGLFALYIAYEPKDDFESATLKK
jgi:intracellular septation protein